jgi:hypothetical protein
VEVAFVDRKYLPKRTDGISDNEIEGDTKKKRKLSYTKNNKFVQLLE